MGCNAPFSFMPTYDSARSKIKSGDLLAWTHKEWGSWYNFQVQMVRMFTRSEYSHVGIAYVVADRVFVLESVVGGIRQTPLSTMVPFYWLPLSDYWNDDVLKAAMSKLGQQYSKWDGFKSLWKKIKPGTDNNWECAEYAQFILQQGKFPIDVRNIPGEVVDWVQTNSDAALYTVTP